MPWHTTPLLTHTNFFSFRCLPGAGTYVTPRLIMLAVSSLPAKFSFRFFSFLYVPETYRWFPLFNLLRPVGPGRCLIVTDFIQCCNVTNSVVPIYFPSPSFFVGATSLVLQKQLSQFLHVLQTQPSSCTFWLNGLLCKLCKLCINVEKFCGLAFGLQGLQKKAFSQEVRLLACS